MRGIKIEIHPLSALLGAALAVGLTITAGAAQLPVAPNTVQRVAIAGPVEVAGQPPHPRDWIQIDEGSPFPVPSGKLFVVTALGATGDQTATLRIDGADVLISTANQSPTTMAPLPEGFVVAGGKSVSVANDGTTGRAWGYLVDA